MKFGIRIPSIKKRISSRLSIKKMISSKIRVPKGFGVFTNPKKFLYNKIYNKTTISSDKLIKKAFSTTKGKKIRSNNLVLKILIWLFLWPILIPLEIFKIISKNTKKQSKPEEIEKIILDSEK